MVSPLPVEGMDDLDCSSGARIATQGNCSCLLRRPHVPVEKGRQLEHPLSGVISLMFPFGVAGTTWAWWERDWRCAQMSSRTRTDARWGRSTGGT
jgi:hypothetical protein